MKGLNLKFNEGQRQEENTSFYPNVCSGLYWNPRLYHSVLHKYKSHWHGLWALPSIHQLCEGADRNDRTLESIQIGCKYFIIPSIWASFFRLISDVKPTRCFIPGMRGKIVIETILQSGQDVLTDLARLLAAVLWAVDVLHIIPGLE